ncbi:MAG: hypothetical protein CME63_11490 [Halobacteriovoraceae bacterium]|nr:hypothetical protein [Halobacteriovoraceae bacterium]
MNCKTLLVMIPALFSSVTHAGIIEPHVTWDKNELKTCFLSDESQLAQTQLKSKKYTKENYDFSPKYLSKRKRENVKHIISKEFTPERTGLHFTGFIDCKNMRNPDVIVMRAASKIILLDTPSFRGRAVIGQDGNFFYATDDDGNYVMDPDGTFHEGFFQKSGKVAFVALRTTNAGTIVHEFGHVAGLRHEHIRPEAEQDDNCHNFSVVWPTEEKLYDTAQLETNYDPLSIMNYCYLQTNRRKFEDKVGNILSEKDKQTLKAYY